eukprot:TRINITY_DN105646_c0_g1_i1.p1 TRINITY_DN105646_c0_g1~~TRINITY_DN105646_c0_g1_i1.p1  ORF type:complete len:307 (+),score=43.35 TRINITY_DN105646_c0_g1_i1:57-977(+)
MATPRGTTDPVMEIMGWHGEPLLLQRLKYHIGEAVLELAAIATCIYFADLRLSPHGLFMRLLCLPLTVVSIKLCWALQLAWSYLRIKSADMPTAMQRMGCLHSRSHWTCSVAMFTCFSCLLMVWHAIVFLLMLCYEIQPGQAFAVRLMMISSASFVAINWAFWRDFVRNYRDTSEDEGRGFAGLYKLQILCKLYKTKVIRSLRLDELSAEDGTQDVCTVCLEEFKKEDTLSRLPCGHVFHTTCVNKWVLEDWRCPFRCSLDLPRNEQKQRVEAWPERHAQGTASVDVSGVPAGGGQHLRDLEVQEV